MEKRCVFESEVRKYTNTDTRNIEIKYMFVTQELFSCITCIGLRGQCLQRTEACRVRLGLNEEAHCWFSVNVPTGSGHTGSVCAGGETQPPIWAFRWSVQRYCGHFLCQTPRFGLRSPQEDQGGPLKWNCSCYWGVGGWGGQEVHLPSAFTPALPSPPERLQVSEMNFRVKQWSWT